LKNASPIPVPVNGPVNVTGQAAAAAIASDAALADAITALEVLAMTGGDGENDPCKPKAPAPLGRGNTGRTVPENLKEKLAMEEAMADPFGKAIDATSTPMKDPRWPATDGWIKTRNVDNTVHWVRNPKTGQVDDFKFKD